MLHYGLFLLAVWPRQQRHVALRWLFCSVLFSLLSSFAVAAAAPSSSSTTLLFDDLSSSVRALNEFGNAEQLEAAQRATERASTIVLLQRGKVVHVVSVQQQQASSYQRAPCLQVVQRISMSVTQNDNTNHHDTSASASAYLICTGLQGDARWLTQRLRRYASRLWDVSAASTGAALAMAAAALLRLFWGHPVHVAVPSPVLQGMLQSSSSDSSDISWGRPMGLHVALLSFDDSSTLTSSSSSAAHVYVINPAGNIACTTAGDDHDDEDDNESFQILACMGHAHDAVRQALERVQHKQAAAAADYNDDEWLEKVVLTAVAEGLGSTVSLLQASRRIQVQTLTPKGMQPMRVWKR